MKKVLLIIAILLGVVGCKKEENKIEECLDETDLEMKFVVWDKKDNFSDSKIENDKLDTSKFYLFFFDDGVQKLIPFRYEFGNMEKEYRALFGEKFKYYEVFLYPTNKEDVFVKKREDLYKRCLWNTYL